MSPTTGPFAPPSHPLSRPFLPSPGLSSGLRALRAARSLVSGIWVEVVYPWARGAVWRVWLLLEAAQLFPCPHSHHAQKLPQAADPDLGPFRHAGLLPGSSFGVTGFQGFGISFTEAHSKKYCVFFTAPVHTSRTGCLPRTGPGWLPARRLVRDQLGGSPAGDGERERMRVGAFPPGLPQAGRPPPSAGDHSSRGSLPTLLSLFPGSGNAFLLQDQGRERSPTVPSPGPALSLVVFLHDAHAFVSGPFIK